MTLVEFLLARIAEDEAALETARRMGVPPLPMGSRIGSGIGNHPTMSETRMAAECDAKRRVVDLYREAVEFFWFAERSALEPVIKLLARPYRDHPDYQQEWTP